VGENIHVKDLQVPQGVVVTTESTDVVATVLAPQKGDETDAEETPAAEKVEAKADKEE
jgi:large subunit ribosomal protein L25